MAAKAILEISTGGRTMRLGVTARPEALRAVRDALLADAAESSRALDGLDPAVQSLKAAETRRLASTLSDLLPDSVFASRPHLGLVPRKEDTMSKPIHISEFAQRHGVAEGTANAMVKEVYERMENDPDQPRVFLEPSDVGLEDRAGHVVTPAEMREAARRNTAELKLLRRQLEDRDGSEELWHAQRLIIDGGPGRMVHKEGATSRTNQPVAVRTWHEAASDLYDRYAAQNQLDGRAVATWFAWMSNDRVLRPEFWASVDAEQVAGTAEHKRAVDIQEGRKAIDRERGYAAERDALTLVHEADARLEREAEERLAAGRARVDRAKRG